jgi:hypothetical protein
MVQKTETGPTSNKNEMLLTPIHVRDFRLYRNTVQRFAFLSCAAKVGLLPTFQHDMWVPSARVSIDLCLGRSRLDQYAVPKSSVTNHLTCSEQQPRIMKIRPIDVRSVFF